MNIRPVGADFFHADRRTDMTKLIVAFRDFANGTKNPPAQFFGSRSHQPLEQILA